MMDREFVIWLSGYAKAIDDSDQTAPSERQWKNVVKGLEMINHFMNIEEANKKSSEFEDRVNKFLHKPRH